MTYLDKIKVFNEWIHKKNKYCKDMSSISFEEKGLLIDIMENQIDSMDEQIMFFIDELKTLRKTKKATSYVFTYKQAQSLVFCCNELGYNIDVEVVYDQKEVDDILEEFDTDFKIIQELDYLFFDYIKITKKGMLKNEVYKKEIKACV